MTVYQERFTVSPEGLSTRELFKHLQDAAGSQCAPLQLAGPDLEKLGLMWVIIKYRVQVERWPQPGETFAVSTWPGRTRHGMMPRFYTLRDARGGLGIAVSSVWAVVDRKTRAMVNSEAFGVRLDPVETGEELRLPGAVKRLETPNRGRFTVPAAYLDENGHMNNTYYYTEAERCIGRDARHDRLAAIATEHVNEALCGEEVALSWGEEGGLYYIAGSNGDKTVFRMNLRYRDGA